MKSGKKDTQLKLVTTEEYGPASAEGDGIQLLKNSEFERGQKAIWNRSILHLLEADKGGEPKSFEVYSRREKGQRNISAAAVKSGRKDTWLKFGYNRRAWSSI